MSDIVISVDNVGRMFKRYRNPRYRVMEALGLRLPKNAFDEFWALRDISFTVERGERLALIGRNGAGKSTLLNVVYGRLQPSLGSVTVHGKIQALMEIGTGFHPEFTGRENILSSLAFQGISGKKARALLDEVIEFSELDDFIDQPVKSYSTGMYARLAFSTSTVFEPDVLIIDEILGAGDAYFAAKCTERMRRLTTETGATVLFVSHDLASAERLCNRAIWIERGQIHMSGSTREVSKSYHASILLQEEARLRARTTVAVSRMRRDVRDPALETLFQIRLATEGGGLPQASHPIRRLSLTIADGLRLEVRPGAPMDTDTSYDAFLFVDPEYALWSLPRREAEEMVRCVENTGGKYLHAQAFFNVPALQRGKPLALEIEHAANVAERLAVEVYDPSDPPGYRRLGLLSERDNQEWRIDQFSIDLRMLTIQPAASADAEQATSGEMFPSVQGQLVAEQRSYQDKWTTSEAAFVEIAPWDKTGSKPQFVFSLGEPITFRIVVDIHTVLPVLWLAASFYDKLGNRVFLAIHEFTSGAPIGRHEIYLTLERPNLRQGEFAVTFEMLPEFDLDFRGPGRLPYLCFWDRCVFFKVDEGHRGLIELGLVEVASRVTSPTLADAQPVGRVRHEQELRSIGQDDGRFVRLS